MPSTSRGTSAEEFGAADDGLPMNPFVGIRTCESDGPLGGQFPGVCADRKDVHIELAAEWPSMPHSWKGVLLRNGRRRRSTRVSLPVGLEGGPVMRRECLHGPCFRGVIASLRRNGLSAAGVYLHSRKDDASLSPSYDRCHGLARKHLVRPAQPRPRGPKVPNGAERA